LVNLFCAASADKHTGNSWLPNRPGKGKVNHANASLGGFGAQAIYHTPPCFGEIKRLMTGDDLETCSFWDFSVAAVFAC